MAKGCSFSVYCIGSDKDLHPRRPAGCLTCVTVESKVKVWDWVVLWSQLGDTILV